VPKDDPAWNTTPRAYSLALKRLGAVEMVSGALDASERHYREALAIEEDLLRKQPDNTQWQFEMSYTLSDLGAARVRQGDVDGAMTVWMRALALRRTAIEADPKNVRAINAMASILNRVGRWQRERKQYPEAMATLREELRLRDTSISILGPSRARLLDQGFALVNLTALLLDLAEADATPRGMAAARANAAAEARALFQSVKLDDLKAPGTGAIDAEFRKWYDTQATRLARR
jgi:tetratricopeptide (TPR) repeat protein